MPVFSNVTVLGPIDKRGAGRSRNYENAIDFRRSAGVSLFNSVIAGFPTGSRVDGDQTAAHYRNGAAVVAHNVLLIDSGNVANRYRGTTGSSDSTARAIWETLGQSNQTIVDTNLAILAGYSFSDPMPFFRFIEGRANPNLQLPTGSPLATGADFSHPKLSGGFFEQVPFRGALSPTNDWMRGWTHFDPQNAPY